MENGREFVIIIDKDTRLGKKEFVQGQIHGIVSTLISITDGVEPQNVFTKPDVDTKSHMTMYITCSPEAFKLIKQQVTAHYPKVCLFGQYDLD